MVTTSPPRTPVATPFSGASGSNLQTTKYQPRGQRTFTPLYMPLSKALGVLIRKGHLKPLEPRPLPNPLPPFYNPAKYCVYHQQYGHDNDQCFRLRHEIQHLIDNRVIVPPEKPNVTTNPLPPHNQAPPPKRINFIQTGVVSYDPSIYITPSHLPKPEVFIPDNTDLCMLDISRTQPEPMVVTVKDRTGMTSEENGIVESESEEGVSFAEEVYNPSGYIASAGQKGTLLTFEFSTNKIRGDMTVNWLDFEESAEVTGWLDDQPDIVEESQLEKGPSEVRTSVVAGRVGDQNTSPESTGAKIFARDLGILDTGNFEQQTTLTQLEQERSEDSERARKTKAPVGTESVACTGTEGAVNVRTEGTVSTRTVMRTGEAINRMIPGTLVKLTI
ncbi:hypothetical protein HYC85_027753 [Camellia sinensis]|uniref:Uncharacterized protein n=1 Tax=Camellia sinensis TaxID=4442 RepID=A0A7J7FTC8_CAMSI|nr:hypothetical protein HYC85_027753 [Camellia sinensis]